MTYWNRRTFAFLDWVRPEGIVLSWESLVRWHEGRCACCGNDDPDSQRVIDHDHKTGFVRGVVCASCNQLLRWEGDTGASRWAEGCNPFAVYDVRETYRRGMARHVLPPVRTIGISDELWQAAQEKARREGSSLSSVVEALLARWTKEK